MIKTILDLITYIPTVYKIINGLYKANKNAKANKDAKASKQDVD